MPTIGFYRQARFDRAVRSGVTVNDETALHLFEPGDDEANPAILWFVEVLFEGRQLPTETEEVQHWLLAAKPHVQDALREAAAQLEVGVDKDVFPYEHVASKPPEGVKITVRCSAVRRLEGLQIARHLASVGRAWTRIIKALNAMELA